MNRFAGPLGKQDEQRLFRRAGGGDLSQWGDGLEVLLWGAPLHFPGQEAGLGSIGYRARPGI